MLDACAARNLSVPDVTDSQSLTGRGIAGTLLDRRLALGNRRLLEETGLNPGTLADAATAWEAEGRTLSWLIEQSPQPQVLGLFAFGDTLKTGALSAVQQLTERHISSHLLTGDNKGSARVVAEALGIKDVHAEVLPADKAATVVELKKPAWWRWSATASTTPRRSPQPISGLQWAAALTWPCTQRASR